MHALLHAICGHFQQNPLILAACPLFFTFDISIKSVSYHSLLFIPMCNVAMPSMRILQSSQNLGLSSYKGLPDNSHYYGVYVTVLLVFVYDLYMAYVFEFILKVTVATSY